MSEPAIPTARAVLHTSGELRRYHPGGGARPAALLAVLLATAASAIAAGLLVGYVSQWFSIVMLYPAIIGGVAGGVAALVVGKVHLRAPMLALALGVLGGSTGYLANHVARYLTVRADVAKELRTAAPTASDAEIDAEIDREILTETGHAGFRGYLDIAAKAGVSIKRTGSSAKGADFTGTGVWIYWGIELLIVIALAGWIARSRAREPFCAGCTNWFGPQFVTRGGPASKANVQEFNRLIIGGLPEQAAGVFVGSDPMAISHFELVTRQCPKCATDVHCLLRSATVTSNKAEHSNFEEFLLAAPESARLLSAIDQRQNARG